MSIQERAGIRAARTLLTLLEENTAEDFEAAESIIGAKELTHILQLLRQYKEYEEEPFTVERLREIVRTELVGLPIPSSGMKVITQMMTSPRGEVLAVPRGVTKEQFVSRLLHFIEEESMSPKEEVTALTRLLAEGFKHAGPEHEGRLMDLVSGLAAQTLFENLVMFPTRHSIAKLRTRYADEPLPYQNQEPRRQLVSRLLADAQHGLQPGGQLQNTLNLLREGMRGPADAEIAAVRRMRPKKANGA